MLGKVLMVIWGLFLCGHAMASEEKEPALGTREEMEAEREGKKQNDPNRDVALSDPPAPSQPVVRCARGVYSFDCATPKAVMRADLAVLDQKPSCVLRNFLKPGWRCD